MKIGILCHRQQPICQPFVGGLEAYTRYFIDALRKQGYELMIYAASGSHVGHAYYSYPNILKKSGYIPEEQCIQTRASDIDIRYALDHMSQECNIIINNSLSSAPILYQEHSSIPILTTFHLNTRYGPYTSSIIELASRGFVNGNYVAISPYSAQERKKYIPDITTIPNGVVLDKRDYYDHPDSTDPYMAWVGRICPEKGTHEAIQIAQKAGITLKIAGKIFDQNYYKTQVSPYLCDTIQYLGILSQPQLNALYGNAQAFWFTSTWEEPFGLVQIEALASGCPVIAYRSGAASTIITHEVGRTVSIGDHEGFIEALREIKNISRQDCRSHVKNTYSRQHMMQQYLTHMHRLVRKTSLQTVSKQLSLQTHLGVMPTFLQSGVTK